MNLTKEQVGLAVHSGLELLGPNSSIQIPARLNDGVYTLKILLHGIAAGRIALSTAVHEDPPKPIVEVPEKDE